MSELLKVLARRGARRGPQRPGLPSPVRRGSRRAPRPNWLVGEPGPEADALAIDLLLGYDPRGRFV